MFHLKSFAPVSKNFAYLVLLKFWFNADVPNTAAKYQQLYVLATFSAQDPFHSKDIFCVMK